jgi:hypothetical protein
VTSIRARFELALKSTDDRHWQQFESLSDAIMATEFPTLVPMAAKAGDGGRDAALKRPEDSETVCLQYSVTPSWDSKIRRTVHRLEQTNPDVAVLVYVSPAEIGADADDLRTWCRGRNIHLDVRDGSWLLSRCGTSPAAHEAATWYADYVLKYVLPERTTASAGASLTGEESQSALVYLVLQRRDDDADRNLTKLCYDALVRASLRGTDSNNRIPRAELHERVITLLPSHQPDEVRLYVDRALGRMEKGAVRHWKKEDEYCLSYEEISRTREEQSEVFLLDDELREKIAAIIRAVADPLGINLGTMNMDDACRRCRRVLERYLFMRGESFVRSLEVGQASLLAREDLETVATEDLSRHPDSSSLRGHVVDLTIAVVERLLDAPEADEQIRAYLQAIADAYTLFAFLRESPNVQSAVEKLFSNGDIWLDTSAVLPVLAETLLDPPSRRYTHLLLAMVEAGAKLHVTHGVLEEVNKHIDNSLLAYRLASSYRGRTPFLLSAYIWSGAESGGFTAWIDEFKGGARPIEDLQMFLEDEFNILTTDLLADVDALEDELVWHATSVWEDIHNRRRTRVAGETIDPGVLDQLVQHDVECFLGVIARRDGEQIDNPFGYSSWWLTLDRKAFTAAAAVKDRSGYEVDSPVLSFDFLTFYLAVGPARRSLRSGISQLPLIGDMPVLDELPETLLSAAEQVRSSMRGQSERVIRRRIRDHLDSEKIRNQGDGRTTFDTLQADIEQALKASGRGH